MTSAGQGVVAHPSGATVFAAGVWLSEQAVFRITRIKGRVGFAELVELKRACESRRQAPCSYHGHQRGACGACPWMFVDYDAQLLAKQRRVENNIQRIAPELTVSTIWPSADEFGWRNRVQFKTDGKKLGFVSASSQTLVDVDRCPVLTEANQQTLLKLRAMLPNSNWKAPSRKQPWSTIDVEQRGGLDGASLNQRLPFQQANSQQNTAMRAWLHNKIAAMRERGQADSALELFCGSGNFTEAIAAAGVANIHALEASEQAVAELSQKNIPGVQAEVADLFSEQSFESLMKKHKQTDMLVLDPPRDGLKQKQGLFDKRARFKAVFYISCDLATFCRDARAFVAAGYQLQELQPVDQFPQTPHVELLAHFVARR
ncbi:class I SAM-dependent RNA methyltransferase [Agaribacterium haliotis]|uniref:class I SAM-dependent RNA methyltransferase n=1 Tax=Agaribacterium haliotis TaxID=2013869 RepID=UPI001177E683|nr:RsmD family RNA methyltransferase [Agaribacterium haliotis]